MAKIAAELDRALTRRRDDGTPGQTRPRILARGDGWTAADVLCTSGPSDCPFEERHERYAIAAVLAGSFQYRSATGRGLLTPGSLMLGNQGDCFECGHEHGEGDRCVSFWYAPDYFERLAADAGVRSANLRFKVPPCRRCVTGRRRCARGCRRNRLERGGMGGNRRETGRRRDPEGRRYVIRCRHAAVQRGGPRDEDDSDDRPVSGSPTDAGCACSRCRAEPISLPADV